MQPRSDRSDVLPNSNRKAIRERLLPGLKNRILQVLARIAPRATTTRVRLNRWRGVNIGKNVWIGYDAIIETSYPHLVTIRDRATIGIRTTIIAHNREQRGVVIEEDVTLGPGVIVLPNVTIGRGAIVTAGSVVTKSVPSKTMVQGNPARPIASVEVPLGLEVSVKNSPKVFDRLRQHLPTIGQSRTAHSFCLEAHCVQKRLILSRS